MPDAQAVFLCLIFVKVGQAFGIESFKLKNPDEIDNAIEKTLNATNPVICEVLVNPDYIFIPKLSAKNFLTGL